MSFFGELRRRNVFRVGVAYLAAVWVLIEVADTIVPIIGAPAGILQALVVSAALGFPVVLFLAWVYEWTPEGIKATSEVDGSEPVAFLGRKVDFAIIGLLVLAVGFLVVDNYVLETDSVLTAADERSIAVLPFVNMSSDPEQEYFSDGISEELLNLLAQVPELRVISRSSAFALKGQAIDIPTVAERLNVDHVLEGSVRKAGDQIRVTAQLIDARSDTHLWSQTYDRTLDDIFALQDEIAANVLGELQIALLGTAPEVDRTDPEAYALYLQAHHIINQGVVDGFPLADQALNQALAIDPDYVPALMELGRLYINQGTRQLRPIEEALELTGELVDRAYEVDPESGGVHAGLAWMARRTGEDLATVAYHTERALALDPTNTDVLRLVSGYVTLLGYPEEGLYLREYVVARDPTCIVCLRGLANAYYRRMRLDEAEATIRTAQSLSPGRAPDHEMLGYILLLKGEPEAALAEFERVDEADVRLEAVTLALYGLGRQEEFEASFNELRDTWGDENPMSVAPIYAYMGELDLAFEWLERGLDMGRSPIGISADPIFAEMHTDPRWPEVLERMGISPAQLEALDFQVTLPR